MATSITRRIAIGAGWIISLRLVTRLIQLGSIAILARLILPEDFGLVGYALVFLAILEQFFMFGFDTVLIRDLDATPERYSTVWTLELIKGILLAAILVASAVPVAEFFGEPQVESIVYWFALIPLLTGVTNVGIVDFQKDLTLHKEFLFLVISRLGGTISTIVFAFMLRNYWALVYGSIIRYVLRVILSYVMSDFRPRLRLSEFQRVFGFSKWLLVQNIFAGLNQRLPVIVIGRYLNAQVLAFFNMATELTNLATQEFAAPIRRALYPGITKMQDDQYRMAETLRKSLGVIVLLGLPATIGIGVTAPVLIPAFLGENWTEVIPIIAVLCLQAAAFIVYPNSHVVYYAMDKPRITAHISILRVCMLAPTMIIVIPNYGALGAAWGLVAINWFMTIVEYVVMYRVTAFTFADTVSAVWRSTISVVIMAICVTLTVRYPPAPAIQESAVLHLALSVAMGFITYVASVLVLWWVSGKPDGAEAYVFRQVQRLLGKKQLPSATEAK